MTETQANGATPAEPLHHTSTEATAETETAPLHSEAAADAHAAEQPHTPPPAPAPVPVAPQQGAYPGHGQQHVAGGYQAHPGQMVVAPKNPAVAALASFFICGLGQVINGDMARGVIIFASVFAMGALSAILTIVFLGWIMWPFIFGTWLWQIFDAHKGAQKWNAQHGIIS